MVSSCQGFTTLWCLNADSWDKDSSHLISSIRFSVCVKLVCLYFNFMVSKRWSVLVAVHFLAYNLLSFMCKSFHKLAQGVTLGCLVQRNPGVKPVRSSAVRVTEFTPKLSPFSLKTRRVPDGLSSFPTLQDCGDLLPQYTAHINISSTCHHPGLQGGTLKALWSAF